MGGFALLTLTVFSGVLFSEQLFGRPVALSHKTVFALMSWLIFCRVDVGRWRHGWRGRLAVRWTLAGFVLLLLAYVGSKLCWKCCCTVWGDLGAPVLRVKTTIASALLAMLAS